MPVRAQVDSTPPPDSTGEPDYLRSQRLGINHISGGDIPTSPERYARALELGAGWNRWAMYWNAIETRDGDFDWERYDAVIESDLDAGLNTNVILLGIPAFHRDGETIANLFEPIFDDNTDLPDEGKFINPDNPFAAFVFRAVQRYMPGGLLAQAQNWTHGRGITVWEVWNEPDFTQFWSGGASDYARMLKIAHIVAHALDPDTTVMVGGLLYPTQSNWLASVMRIINRDPMKDDHGWFMDAVGVHSYTDAWRSGWLTLYTRQTLVEFGIERPIWLNESGAPLWDVYPGPTWLGDDPAARQNRLRAEEQADYFLQSAAWAYAEGAAVVFLFQLYDDCGNQPPGTNFPPHNGDLCSGDGACFGDAFGMYSNASNAVCFARHPQPDRARPVAEAYQLAAEVFGGVPFSPRGVIDTQTRNGAVIITFSRPTTDERVIVLWNILPEAIRLSLPALGESAQLITLDGRDTLLPTTASGEDRPLYALTLPPSRSDRQPPDDSSALPNGGSALILIERIPEAESINLQVRTFARPASDALPLTATPLPELGVADAEIQARLAASPSGAIFTALQPARFRNYPNTGNSTVLGVMPPNNSASIIGRLADDSWYLLDYTDQPVWIAAFLGQMTGSLANVPILDDPSPAPTATPETPTLEPTPGDAPPAEPTAGG